MYKAKKKFLPQPPYIITGHFKKASSDIHITLPLHLYFPPFFLFFFLGVDDGVDDVSLFSATAALAVGGGTGALLREVGVLFLPECMIDMRKEPMAPVAM
jgi:hypothetical protein